MLKKPSTVFFHKPSKKDNIHLQLPNLTISNRKMKKEESIKFLGVFLNENVIWKQYLKLIKNNCAKNIGLSYQAKHHLSKKCLLALYYSYVYNYIIYVNIAWESTNAIHNVHDKRKFEHTNTFKYTKYCYVYAQYFN